MEVCEFHLRWVSDNLFSFKISLKVAPNGISRRPAWGKKKEQKYFRESRNKNLFFRKNLNLMALKKPNGTFLAENVFFLRFLLSEIQKPKPETSKNQNEIQPFCEKNSQNKSHHARVFGLINAFSYPKLSKTQRGPFPKIDVFSEKSESNAQIPFNPNMYVKIRMGDQSFDTANKNC